LAVDSDSVYGLTLGLSAPDKSTSGDTSTSARGCVLESITPCGVLTDAASHCSGCKQSSLALPAAACCLNQRSALAELLATQAAAVSARGAPSHGWRACSSALGSVSWPLRLSLVSGQSSVSWTNQCQLPRRPGLRLHPQKRGIQMGTIQAPEVHHLGTVQTPGLHHRY